MKKTISILSIISLCVAATALLLAIALLTVFWKPACRLYGASVDVMAAGPAISVSSVVSMLTGLAIAVGACVFTKSSRTIVFEIIAVLLIIGIPVLDTLLSHVEAAAIGHWAGGEKLVALSMSSSIISVAAGLMGKAKALCLVICGMSISEKVISKRIASEAKQTIA